MTDRWNQQTAAENHGWRLPLSRPLHLRFTHAAAQANLLGFSLEPSLFLPLHSQYCQPIIWALPLK